MFLFLTFFTNKKLY